MKYFFLSDGWDVGRVWEFGGLWSEATWRRRPDIQKLNLCIWEHGEKLWLYRVEEDVIMVEVKPGYEEIDRLLANNPENSSPPEITSEITSEITPEMTPEITSKIIGESPPLNPRINPIGKVILKRLITAEQAIDYINKSTVSS